MPKFAINSLMPIDTPREDGNHTAPLMRKDFFPPGLMEIQTPKADADAIVEVVQGFNINGMTLVLGEDLLTYDVTPDS